MSHIGSNPVAGAAAWALAVAVIPAPGVAAGLVSRARRRDRRPLPDPARPTRRRKTHVSVAIAYRAIQHGFDALFTTAAHWIEDLSNAGRTGRLHDALDRYTHPHVLVTRSAISPTALRRPACSTTWSTIGIAGNGRWSSRLPLDGRAARVAAALQWATPARR